jgi:hypothetical protein
MILELNYIKINFKKELKFQINLFFILIIVCCKGETDQIPTSFIDKFDSLNE